MRRSLLCICLLIFICFFTLPVLAQQIKLNNLILDNLGKKIQLRFGIEFDNLKELKAMVLEGESIRLSCQASLYRKRSMWWDESISESVLTYELTHNPLTKKFIMQNIDLNRTMSNPELEPLIQSNWERIALDLGSWQALQDGSEYILDLSVNLEWSDIPGWLDTLLFFWSFEVISAKHYQMNFTK